MAVGGFQSTRGWVTKATLRVILTSRGEQKFRAFTYATKPGQWSPFASHRCAHTHTEGSRSASLVGLPVLSPSHPPPPPSRLLRRQTPTMFCIIQLTRALDAF
uniref:Uncharacterized protein n=1 Tax=Mesocestoides corti TaxID=53468 RepID=A0A5K3EQ69_MESCO